MFTVYTITENGVVKYVGKTSNFTNRKRQHLNYRGTSYSVIPTDTDLSTIEIHPIALYTDKVQALKFEDWMIQKHDTINNGWNKQRSGNICEDMKAYDRARRQTPEYKAYQKEYMKEYEQKPERMAYHKAYNKAYRQTPERKAYLKAYEQTPERKAYRKAYYDTPEWKAYRKAYYDTPEWKAYKKEWQRQYRLRKKNKIKDKRQ